MRPRRPISRGSLPLGLAIALLLAPAARGEEPAPLRKLVIVGGGSVPEAIRDRFVDLAGGKDARIVVIPTASASADLKDEAEGFLKPWRSYAPASLTLLHTRSRESADRPDFLRPIDSATAVWFGGGDQARLVEPYLGTAVDRAFRRLLDRGGVIGGTSAGAAAMSDPMIVGGNPVAEVGRGFGFVSNAVIDQHFLRRDRLNRLLGVVAGRPGLIGLGIDEETALVIEGDRWSVVGRSYVLAIEPAREGQPPRFASFGDGDRGRFPKSGLPIRDQSPARED